MFIQYIYIYFNYVLSIYQCIFSQAISTTVKNSFSFKLSSSPESQNVFGKTFY